MKLATLNITLSAGNRTLVLSRYEFNHALECMGEKVVPWGGLPADHFRAKVALVKRNLARNSKEFTKDGCEVKVAKEKVWMNPITLDKLNKLFSKLETFSTEAGDNEITF
jgi:hypothetical protein